MMADLVELKVCIETAHDPLSSESEKNRCLEIIEKFKNDSKDILQVGAQFIDKDNGNFVRLYGLQLIDHFIKFSWNNLEFAEQENIKATLLNILKTNVLKADGEPIFIKQKFSSLIVEVVKRQYPQFWQTFLNDFKNIAKIDALRMEIVVLTFHELCMQISLETIHPLNRRVEITKAFSQAEKEFFTFILDLLVSEFPKNRSETLNMHILKTINHFCDFCKWNTVLDPDYTFKILYDNLLTLLANEKYTLEALNALIGLMTLTVRKVKAKIGDFVMIIFSNDALQMIFKFHEMLNGCQDSFPIAKLREIFANFVVLLLTCIISLNKDSITTEKLIEPLFDVFYSLILSHISRTTKLFTSVNNQLLKSKTLFMCNQYKSSLIKAFPLMNKFLNPKHDLSQFDSTLKFADDAELQSFYSRIRAEIITFIDRATEKVPDVAGLYLAECIKVIQGWLDSGDFSNLPCEIENCWEASMVIIKSFLTNDKESAIEFLSTNELNNFFTKCFEIKSNDMTVLKFSSSAVSNLIFLAFKDQSILLKSLEFSLSFVFSRNEIFTKETKESEIKDYINTTLNSFQKIFNTFSKEIYKIDPKILKLIYEAVQPIIWSEDINNMTHQYLSHIHLLVPIILLSNESKDIILQRQLANEIFDPVKAFFSTPEFQSVLESPEKFIKGCTISKIEDSGAIMRHKLNLSLEIISSINRNCQSSQSGTFEYFGTLVIAEVIPIVFKIIWLINTMLTTEKTMTTINQQNLARSDVQYKPILPYIDHIYSLCLIILGDIIDKNSEYFASTENCQQMIDFAIVPFVDRIDIKFLNLNVKNFLLHFPKRMYSGSNEANKKLVTQFYSSILAPLLIKLGARLNELMAECVAFDEQDVQGLRPEELKQKIENSAMTRRVMVMFLQIVDGFICEERVKNSPVIDTLRFNFSLRKINSKYNLEPSPFLVEALKTVKPDTLAWLKEVLNQLLQILTCKYTEVATKSIFCIAAVLNMFVKKESTEISQNEALNIFYSLIRSLGVHGHVEESFDNFITLSCAFYWAVKFHFPIYKTLCGIDSINKDFLAKFNSDVSINTMSKAQEKTLKENFKKAFDNHINKPLQKLHSIENIIKNLPQNSQIPKIANGGNSFLTNG